MEYEFLVGHRVKINWFNDYYKRKYEYIGSVSKVIIDNPEYEKIYIAIEDKGNIEWICPNHPHIIEFSVKILDNEIKKYTKFTRFEIMEI